MQHVPTSLQDLLNLDVVGAEAAVEFEVVGVVEEGAPQREQQLLWTEMSVSQRPRAGGAARKCKHVKSQSDRSALSLDDTPPLPATPVICFSPTHPVTDGF